MQTTLDAQIHDFPRGRADSRQRYRADTDLRDGSRGLFPRQEAFATPIAVLMMFVGLVLLLACANIATLMLARGARRQREMRVGLAHGAGRGRILRQMVVESLLLATIRGLSGLAIAYAARGAVAQYTPHIDWQVSVLPMRSRSSPGYASGSRRQESWRHSGGAGNGAMDCLGLLTNVVEAPGSAALSWRRSSEK